MNHQVEHDADKYRFIVKEEGEVAEQVYRTQDDHLYIMRTEVPEALGGRGIAGELIRATLDYGKEKGYQITVYCPFVKSYLRHHPELGEGIHF